MSLFREAVILKYLMLLLFAKRIFKWLVNYKEQLRLLLQIKRKILQIHFMAVSALIWLFSRTDLQTKMKQVTMCLLAYAAYRQFVFGSVSKMHEQFLNVYEFYSSIYAFSIVLN